MTQTTAAAQGQRAMHSRLLAGWLIPSPDDRAAVVFFWVWFLAWLFGAVYERTERDELC